MTDLMDLTEPSDCQPCKANWGPSIMMRDLRVAYDKMLPAVLDLADEVCTLSMTEDRESIYECQTTIGQIRHSWNSPDLKAIKLRDGHELYLNSSKLRAVLVAHPPGYITFAEHDKRVSELLSANNVEVERRRAAERGITQPPEGDFLLELGKLWPNYTIPMILHCPDCGERHIDEQAFADVAHHTHACQGCGNVWRPAKVNTHGVQFLPGYRNQPQENV
jgi:hypothetical protein